ncbi:MAG: DUF1080 domain-containing protein, partial [Alistipes sp.]|nr:DUF1080 domain-containing protein [Alistipes sp.]
MKRTLRILGVTTVSVAMVACLGKGNKASTAEAEAGDAVEVTTGDDENTIVLFDGTSLEGWRGYNRADLPARWVIDNGALKFNGSGGGEAQENDGGDIIYDRKFGNFELTFEWKISKGGNSGVFFYAQEVPGEPIFISAPEYQILDNENHPDAKMGIQGNRQAGSLYDMIAANPQNAKPYGEWNTGGITVYKGSVAHWMNGENVVEYHLWTPQWIQMIDDSKFSKDKWPLA